MAFAFDPELAPLLTASAEAREGLEPPRNPAKLRETCDAGLRLLAEAMLPIGGVSERAVTVAAPDGAELHAVWCAREGHSPGSAVVYLHGGGMVAGSVATYLPHVRRYVEHTGVPMLAVDYRLAPEHPHPTPVEDCFATLQWLHAHADELTVDASRIAVMGDSAGGGLAAAVALLARDRRVPLAKQILVYPMLDDRTVVPDPALVPFLGWTYESNAIGWRALVGDAVGGPDVSPYAAPARAVDLTGVAPAYLDVGELDIFHDEDVEHCRRLAGAGVSTELHVHPGVPHGFDMLPADARVVQRALADRCRVLGAL